MLHVVPHDVVVPHRMVVVPVVDHMMGMMDHHVMMMMLMDHHLVGESGRRQDEAQGE
jgi:hypothetical protein